MDDLYNGPDTPVVLWSLTAHREACGEISAAGAITLWRTPDALAQVSPRELGRAVWRGLIDGSLMLCERPAEGPSVVFELHEGDPAQRALSRRESEVVARCVRGRSNKEIAYSLGLRPSSVSQALTSATRKLGVSNARLLVRLAAGLRGLPVIPPSLSRAEREVLGLLVLGLSNAAIAAQRGVSGRTVANQIASILRKTGAASRRELISGHANRAADE